MRHLPRHVLSGVPSSLGQGNGSTERGGCCGGAGERVKAKTRQAKDRRTMTQTLTGYRFFAECLTRLLDEETAKGRE